MRLLILAAVATLARSRPENQPGGDPTTRTPLHKAARSGNSTAVSRLLAGGAAALDARDETDKLRTPLHVAAHHHQTAVVRLLLDRGAVVDARDIDGWKPLHEVCHNGNDEIAGILLAAGADMESHADGGWSALHQAAGNSALEVLEMLLKRGAIADVASTAEGLTPLHIAASQGALGAARLLVTHGASPRVTDSGGKTPAFHAEARGHAEVAALLAASASARASDSSSTPPPASSSQAAETQTRSHTKEAAGLASPPEGRCTLVDLAGAADPGAYSIPAHCTELSLSRSGIDAAAATHLAQALR